jgi:hypothetical protein
MKEKPNETIADNSSEELGDVLSLNSDDALLVSLGKTPELKRVYNFWTCKLQTNYNFLQILTHFSMRIPDHDLLQLVMPCRPLLHHFRYRWSIRTGLGNVSGRNGRTMMTRP